MHLTSHAINLMMGVVAVVAGALLAVGAQHVAQIVASNL